MNPFMVTFVMLGVLYAGIGVWSMFMGFGISLCIAVVGVIVCAVGWKYSPEHI